MFSGKTAWFSKSVPSKRIRLWKQHDGKVVNFDKAQYVFSDDCQCPDTRRLYESEAYINEHLAIFHSLYIPECVKKEDATKVVLGDFFLPPLEVMEVIRGQTKMAWERSTVETDDAHSETNDQDDGGECSEENIEEVNQGVDRRISNNGVPHIESLPKVTGVLEEFCPGQNGCVVFMKPR